MFTVFFRGRPKIRSPASTKRDRSTNTTNHSRKCNCVFPTSGTTTTINTRISLHSQLVTLSHTTAAFQTGCQFLSQLFRPLSMFLSHQVYEKKRLTQQNKKKAAEREGVVIRYLALCNAGRRRYIMMKKIQGIVLWSDLIVLCASILGGIVLPIIAQVKEWGVFGLFGRLSPACFASLWAHQTLFRYGLLCWLIAVVSFFLLAVISVWIKE